MFRIGVLSTQTAANSKRYLDAFVQDLQQLGYIESKNVPAGVLLG